MAEVIPQENNPPFPSSGIRGMKPQAQSKVTAGKRSHQIGMAIPRAIR
jgi:hypothetical protein